MIQAEDFGQFFLIGLSLTSLAAMPVFVVGLIWKLRHLMN